MIARPFRQSASRRVWGLGSRALMLVLLVLAATGLRAMPEPAIAPAWELKTPDGTLVRFPQDAQGQPTVLLFWPSWCPFSRALQPYVQDIWEDYRDRGVKVWTINILERGDPLQAMRERGLSFPLLLQGDDLRQTYGITRTPWLVVIDGRQRIVYTRPSDPPSPIDVARAVRETLNGLIGERAVPLPETYPPPYDLHLKSAGDLPDRRTPAPVAASVWGPWLERYLADLGDGEAVAGIEAGGAITDGKQAIARARQVWTARFGEAVVQAQAPYRAYRRNALWVVLGDGLSSELGRGLIAVFDADSGRVRRLAHGGTE